MCFGAWSLSAPFDLVAVGWYLRSSGEYGAGIVMLRCRKSFSSAFAFPAPSPTIGRMTNLFHISALQAVPFGSAGRWL